MSVDARKIERLVALTVRLTEALQADIAALERGRPREMHSHRPDVQQMTALYSREAQGFGVDVVKSLPPESREKLTRATARFREVLALHARILTRVRNATEGMIRAIAEDVAKRRNAQRPYAPQPAATRSPGALIYNNVV
ncbi:MAG: hypothetical protein ACLQUZ_16455 [Rhizomicrobium sp.]